MSLAAPAFATSALWLFLTVWLPAGEAPPVQTSAPTASQPFDAQAHALSTWPAPVVRDDGVASAEPAPTF